MGKCPFCSSSIHEDVLLYGGACPKCFGEIPGEEAATDPGEVVRAKQDASDKRRMAFKALIPMMLAVPAVMAFGVFALGFVWWNQNPVAETMNFDDVEGFDDFEIVAADPSLFEDRPSHEKTVPKAVNHVRPRPTPGGSSDSNPGREPVVKVEPTSGGMGGFGDLPDLDVSRESTALSDPGQIQQMIRRKMSSKQRTLVQCYNNRLKVKSDLQGRWRAYFTVGRDGRAKNVRFQGTNMQDSEFESCLAKEVAKWKFTKITRDQPVEKSWRFKK